MLKTFAAFSAAALMLLASACAQNQRVATETAANDTSVSSTPPFQTKEPERYRATRTITTLSSADIEEITKNLIARDGELRREETDAGGQRVVYLNLAEGRFVLLPEERCLLMRQRSSTSRVALIGMASRRVRRIVCCTRSRFRQRINASAPRL